MRIKTILSLFTFTAAFIFSAAIASVFTPTPVASRNVVTVSFDRATAQNISSFLEQDIENGQNRNVDAYSAEDDATPSNSNISKRAQAVSEYVAESSAMDETNFPQDFQLAWLKHMRAWHNYADFLQKAKTQKMSYAEINQLENQYNREINSTWYDTLRVGRKYGAHVTDY